MGISHRKLSPDYVRNFIFGVEDSLVSTVGLLSGVAIAGMDRRTVFLTGMVLIFVESFSMAVGSFLAEHSARDYARQRETSLRSPFVDGVIMFFSYFTTGFIPLLPYIFFEAGRALWISILGSLAVLFIVGVVSARLSRVSIFTSSVRMVFIGGVAIAVGIIVGKVASGL